MCFFYDINNICSMERISIIYDLKSGISQECSKALAEKLKVDSDLIFDVDKVSSDLLKESNVVVLISAAWCENNCALMLECFNNIDLKGKTIALAGHFANLEDVDAFCGVMRNIANKLNTKGAVFIGKLPFYHFCQENEIFTPDEIYAGVAINEAKIGTVTSKSVMEETKSLNNNSRNEDM